MIEKHLSNFMIKMINDFEDNEDIAEDKRNDGDDRKVCLVKLACCIIIY